MSDDTYEGWTNRETWCMNLWLNNDEGLYSHCRDLAEGASGDFYPYALSDEIKGYVEELFDDADEIQMFRTWKDDVGSLWRVDWVEIAQGFLEE